MSQNKYIGKKGKLFSLQKDVMKRKKIVVSSAMELETKPAITTRPLVFGKFYDDHSPIYMQEGEGHIPIDYSKEEQEYQQPIQQERITIENNVISDETINDRLELNQQPNPTIQKEELNSSEEEEEQQAVRMALASQKAWEQEEDWRDNYRPKKAIQSAAFSKMKEHFHSTQSINLGDFSLQKTFDEVDRINQ